MTNEPTSFGSSAPPASSVAGRPPVPPPPPPPLATPGTAPTGGFSQAPYRPPVAPPTYDPVRPAPSSGYGVATEAPPVAPPRPQPQPQSQFSMTPAGGSPVTPPPEPKKRRFRGALLALCAIALVTGGFLYGRSASNDSQATVERAPSVAAQVEGEDVATSNTVAAQSDEADADDEPGAVPALVADDGDVEPIVAVAKAVGPSVVLIETFDGQGSGIIYDASGLIITNAHVIAGASEVGVMLADGRRVAGEVVGGDADTDIALVKIDSGLDFTPAVFADTDTIEVGQLSVAIGSPFGLEQTVTAGIISAVNRPVASSVQQPRPQLFIQTDAPINPGNSGGALADRQGRVVGMNTLIRTDGANQGNIGVGFAIPADTMQFVAERIIAGEEIQRSFLGIEGNDPLVGEPGAVITKIIEGNPAEAAGLLPGDRIVSFDQREISGMSELAARVRLTPQNQPIEVIVVRDDEPVTVILELVPFEELAE